LGKPGRRSPGLWVDDNGIPPPSPLRAWELGDAFLEGMSLLQMYPVEAAGGIDRLLQTASDLHHRRDEETKARKGDNYGLGARLKATMWRGFANRVTPESPLEEEKEYTSEGNAPDDGNETETPHISSPPGITTRLATTVWRGITNQTVMEPPPSPLTPLSPSPSSSVSPLPSPSPSPSITSPGDSSPQASPASHGSSGIWSYAEKLKDSDTVAALAKVSTNWRAKAMLGGWSIGSGSTKVSQDSVLISPTQPVFRIRGDSVSSGGPFKADNERRVSLPGGTWADTYTPPERPAYFRPPRDSMLPQPRRSPIASPSSPEISPQLDKGFSIKTQNIHASLASLSRSSKPPGTKSVPRPLLLNSSSLITASPSTRSSSGNPRSSRNNSPSDGGQWTDVLRAKGRIMHKASQSSLSSLSPSDAQGSSSKFGYRSDRDSDSGAPSRVIPLNRRAVSPMAAGIRLPPARPTSASSSGTSSERGLASPPISSRHSPSNTISSPLALHSASANSFHGDNEYKKSMSPATTVSLDPPIRKPQRKKTPPFLQSEADDTSDSSLIQPPPKSPRVRPRRSPPDLYLRTGENPRTVTAEQKSLSPNSLAPDNFQDHDIATTPKASTFDHPPSPNSRSARRTRKYSGEELEDKPRKNPDGNEGRVKKILTDLPLRTRKVSGEGREGARSSRDSAAIEGDDEGYDDLLSAYESEESSNVSAFQ